MAQRIIRMNPLRSAMPNVQMGKSAMPIGRSAGISGPTGYMGHFAKPSVIRAGHNTSGSYSKGHSAKHPGFKAVAAKIGKEKGIRNPGAVLASATRKASPAAKKANPRLNRVH